jgi:hypothetical protein
MVSPMETARLQHGARFARQAALYAREAREAGARLQEEAETARAAAADAEAEASAARLAADAFEAEAEAALAAADARAMEAAAAADEAGEGLPEPTRTEGGAEGDGADVPLPLPATPHLPPPATAEHVQSLVQRQEEDAQADAEAETEAEAEAAAASGRRARDAKRAAASLLKPLQQPHGVFQFTRFEPTLGALLRAAASDKAQSDRTAASANASAAGVDDSMCGALRDEGAVLFLHRLVADGTAAAAGGEGGRQRGGFEGTNAEKALAVRVLR